jgi:hypothetical protein
MINLQSSNIATNVIGLTNRLYNSISKALDVKLLSARKSICLYNSQPDNSLGSFSKSLIINVKENFDGRVFGDVTLIKLNKVNQLDSIVHSDKALFNNDNLKLEKAQHYQFVHQNFP